MSGNEFAKNHNKMFNELVTKSIVQSYLNKFKEDSNMKNETYRLALKEELQEIAEEMAVELVRALNEHELEANEYYDRESYYKNPISEREMLHNVIHTLNIIAYGKSN